MMNKICDGCRNKTRRLWGPNFLCYKCYNKTKTPMDRSHPLDYALNKIRKVVPHRGTSGITGTISVPNVLVGKLVKIVLVDSEFVQGASHD